MPPGAVAIVGRDIGHAGSESEENGVRAEHADPNMEIARSRYARSTSTVVPRGAWLGAA